MFYGAHTRTIYCRPGNDFWVSLRHSHNNWSSYRLYNYQPGRTSLLSDLSVSKLGISNLSKRREPQVSLTVGIFPSTLLIKVNQLYRPMLLVWSYEHFDIVTIYAHFSSQSRTRKLSDLHFFRILEYNSLGPTRLLVITLNNNNSYQHYIQTM